MQGAVAAAAVRGRKKRVKSTDQFMADLLQDFFEVDSAENAADRARRLEDMTKGKLAGSTVTFDEGHKKSVKHERQIDGLLMKVSDRMNRSQNYISFASIVVFLILYLTAIFFQLDVATSNEIQTGFQETIIMGMCGGEFCPGGRLGDPEEIFDFLQDEIVDRAWDEPVCGDGTCEEDGNEFKGFGRFGCIADCGRYLFTTQITVDLQTIYNASRNVLRKHNIPGLSAQYQPKGWDLEKLIGDKLVGRKPDFTWNIWSETMGDFLLEKDARPEDGPVVLEVPDGEYELVLYQTRSLADQLDISSITHMRGYGPEIDSTTVPERAEGIADFAYGDKREALAAQSELIAQVFEACSNIPDFANFDWQCWAPPDEIFIEMFGSYGMNGTIKMGNGTRQTANIVEVPFCGITPNGTKGLTVNSAKLALQAAAATCTKSARRRGQTTGRDSRALLAEIPDGTVMHGVSSALFGECKEHKDCHQYTSSTPKGWVPFQTSYYTSPLVSLGMGRPIYFMAGGPGAFCHSTKSCETCGWCQNATGDSIDGTCPQDLCPGSGNFPACVSAEKLLKSWNCPERYKFEVWKYFPKGNADQVVGNPKVRDRLITPFNKLVGNVIVSTERKSATSCRAGAANSTANPGVINPSVIRYIENFQSQSVCLGEDTASESYGYDPVLMPTSSIYDGKATFKSAYQDSENVGFNGLDTGFAFFNHSYDTSNARLKNDSEIVGKYAESFNVYIDSRATQSQASNYVSFLRESGFLDEFTSSVTIQFVTFNIDSNVFCFIEFKYEWQKGGAIEWDWVMRTVSGPPVYRSSTHVLQLPLEILCMIFLAINCILEISDMITAVRIMRPQNYFFNPWNWIDISHFVIMWTGWIAWVRYVERANKFEMNSEYPGVVDPTADVRYFQTNSTQEYAFLTFVEEISGLSQDFRYYSEMIGLSILMFVVRVIKNLDFQERMGLISRTIVAAIPNILHFSILFGLVFFAYLVVAHVLFGHVFEPFSTPEDGAVFLFLTMLIGWDPVDFWDQMTNAAEPWAFYIFIYSLMLILFFILFNVLLGILIDTYCEMKEEVDPDASSFLPEMADILMSNVLDWTINHNKRMPDTKFKAILQEHKAGLPSNDILKEALSKSTAPPDNIILPGGADIDGPTMRKMVVQMSEQQMQQRAVSLQAYNNESESDDEEEAEGEGQWVKMPDGSLKKQMNEEEKKVYVNDDEEMMVTDIVERYAFESIVEDAHKEEAEAKLLQLEHMKRELVMFRAAQLTHQRILDMEDQLDRMALAVLPPEERLPKPVRFGGTDKGQGMRGKLCGVLRVTVVEAKGLPTMDFMGSTDPYALVFLSEPFSDSVTGPVTFRTETRNNTREPVWNADFELPIFPHAQNLTVAIFDYDSITKDDLIGIVNVHLADLETWVQTDKWFQLVNSKMNARRLVASEVHLKVTRLPDASEYLGKNDARKLPSLNEDEEGEHAHVLQP